MQTKHILLIITLNITHLLCAQEFKWGNRVATDHHTYGQDLKLDANKNVYAAGIFKGTLTTILGKDTLNMASYDGFSYVYRKFNRIGELQWVKAVRAGINDGAAITNIAVDNVGNVYATGSFQGTSDFDPGPGVANLTASGIQDFFILKLDASGNFLWVKQIGGTDATCYSNAIAVDGNNNLLITGIFFYGTVDFNPDTLVNKLTPKGPFDAFITKFTSNGDFVWVNQIGGSGEDNSADLKVDQSGDIYVTGPFQGTINFNLVGGGSIGLNARGWFDTYLCKLNTNGQCLWAKQFGGAATITYSKGLALDSDKGAYITGYYRNKVDFNPGLDTFFLKTPNPTVDNTFITKVDANGNFVWAKGIDGSDFSSGNSIAIDGNKNVYTTGSFRGKADFNPGQDSAIFVGAGYDDFFISMLDSLGNHVWVQTIITSSSEEGVDIKVTSNGDLFVLGSFTGNIDVDPGPNQKILSGNGGWYSMFLFRWNQNIGVGLNEASINQVKVYPNPASQQLTVNLTKPAAVEVYSITGKLMGRFNETTSQTIDVSEYAPGIYFLRTTYGNQKFIKE